MEQSEKKQRGAPKKENGQRAWLTIRISEERRAKYQLAADKAQETLSAWIRRVLDRAAK